MAPGTLDGPLNTHTFLQFLPPELRNKIYHFAVSIDQDATVNLLEAQPPSKALIGICRQTYSEARAMYRHAYRDYWRMSIFIISQGSQDRDMLRSLLELGWRETLCLQRRYEQGIYDSLGHLKARDLRRVRYLVIKQQAADPQKPSLTYTLLDNAGLWNMSVSQGGSVRFSGNVHAVISDRPPVETLFRSWPFVPATQEQVISQSKALATFLLEAQIVSLLW